MPSAASAQTEPPPRWLGKYRLEFARLADRQSLVLSYPKSGRTWHRIMLGAYLARRAGIDPFRAFELDAFTVSGDVPRIGYSHNGANFIDDLPSDHPMIASPEPWAGRVVLLLVRDPRDILVSAYHHARYRDRIFDGDLGSFIRSSQTGIAKIVTAYGRWQLNRQRAASFTVLAYEAMLADPKAALSLSLSALGIRAIDERLLGEAVEFATIDKMRRYEEQNAFGHDRLAVLSGDPRGRKVRQGSAGAYRAEFSDEDLAFVATTITAAGGDPFAPLYAQRGNPLQG